MRDGRWHRELGTTCFDALIIAFDVVGEEHGRRLALLKHRLLIRLGCRVIIQRQLQLSAFRFLGRSHSQPAKWAVAEIGLLGESEYIRIEVQSFALVVYVYV